MRRWRGVSIEGGSGLNDMTLKSPKPPQNRRCPGARGFNLVELLVVMAILGILMALLLPGLAGAKARAQRASCQSKLRQIGLGQAMYVSEFGAYPPLWDDGASQTCFDKLSPYYPIAFTNAAWHCPTYLARNGVVFRPPGTTFVAGSYCYNYRGIANGWADGPKAVYQLQLGLGHRSKTMGHSVQEPEVTAPSEMYTVADVRASLEAYTLPGDTAEGKRTGVIGNPKMMPWTFVSGTQELAPPHSEGYNVLFADGHVALVKQRDYFFPPRTAQHWNRDHQPHPEAWAPRSRWVVED